jgi:hypothetical protein
MRIEIDQDEAKKKNQNPLKSHTIEILAWILLSHQNQTNKDKDLRLKMEDSRYVCEFRQ